MRTSILKITGYICPRYHRCTAKSNHIPMVLSWLLTPQHLSHYRGVIMVTVVLPCQSFIARDTEQYFISNLHNLTRSSRGSVVKVTDLHPTSLGSTPTGTHMCHWWQQEGHLTKIAPVSQ